MMENLTSSYTNTDDHDEEVLFERKNPASRESPKKPTTVFKKTSVIIALLAFLSICLVVALIIEKGKNGDDKSPSTTTTAASVIAVTKLVAVSVISGSSVNGTVTFSQNIRGNEADGLVNISGRLNGLSVGKHGFHIHQYGDLTNGCISAGGHYNPRAMTHGAPVDSIRHNGDLGNIEANEQGIAEFSFSDSILMLVGSESILGRAVVVHALTDDLGTGAADSKTTGNAGSRLGCGVIGLTKPS